jgi:hypothetical protein
MAGRRRSGFANDKRGYRCPIACSYTQLVPPNYNGNNNTTGTVIINGSYPYSYGYLGNLYTFIKSRY